jgi:hypothetical protein
MHKQSTRLKSIDGDASFDGNCLLFVYKHGNIYIRLNTNIFQLQNQITEIPTARLWWWAATLHMSKRDESVLMGVDAVEDNRQTWHYYRDIPSLVKKLSLQIKILKAPSVIIVRRANVLEDAIREVKRPNFNPLVKLEVKFLHESSIDCGGLTFFINSFKLFYSFWKF